MKTNFLKAILIIAFTAITTLLEAQEVTQKADAENIAKAKEWVNSLSINNPEKEANVTEVVALHLTQIRDWHNSHPYTLVPAGINPLDGRPLSELHRQMIIDSTIPSSVHQNLMDGLRCKILSIFFSSSFFSKTKFSRTVLPSKTAALILVFPTSIASNIKMIIKIRMYK